MAAERFGAVFEPDQAGAVVVVSAAVPVVADVYLQDAVTFGYLDLDGGGAGVLGGVGQGFSAGCRPPSARRAGCSPRAISRSSSSTSSADATAKWASPLPGGPGSSCAALPRDHPAAPRDREGGLQVGELGKVVRGVDERRVGRLHDLGVVLRAAVITRPRPKPWSSAGIFRGDRGGEVTALNERGRCAGSAMTSRRPKGATGRP